MINATREAQIRRIAVTLKSEFNPRVSSHGLAGEELTKRPLNARTSKQNGNCNASMSQRFLNDACFDLPPSTKLLFPMRT